MMLNIDFHVHITPPDISADWRRYAEKEPYFSLLSENKHNKFAAAEDVVATLGHVADGKAGVVFDKAVVFGFGFRDMGLCRYVNDYVIEKVKEYPEKLIGFISVAPSGNDAAREIERCCNAGLKGVGELFPQGQGIDLENEKSTAAITGICSELSLPVLTHANEPVGHYYPGKTDVTLRQLETFITNNPRLKIVLAHWGGGLLFYETMPEVKEKFRNVYYDTAATPFLYDARIYRAAKALGLCEKILFGSDFPLLPQSRYLDALNESDLSAEEKQLILGGNAQKLLKL
ncbi:MAG: amidohydrolase family protein [Treponema sp.]|jgi:predicted TIM-barrel fold metal-dependent hydrolase|nr:amidohydrolase family protein [Treponema sp.]